MVKSQENLGQNKAHWPSINVCTVSYTGSGFIVLVGFEVSSLWFRVGALGLKAGCMERLDALVFDISLPWLQGLTHTHTACVLINMRAHPETPGPFLKQGTQY